MIFRLLAPALLTCVLIQSPAFAQTNSSGPNAASTQASGQAGQPLPQEIKQKLQKQGFTNVQVVPGSFIVSAKDKEGDPVNMIIGPHSIMMVTTADVSAQQSDNAKSGSQPTDHTKK
jgi:hypothetical protein